MEKPSYGGQAVIEGVMMRGPGRIAVALRRPDGQVGVIAQDFAGWARGRPYLKWPVVRGAIALGEALVLGVSSLLLSAQEMAESEGQKVGKLEMAGTLALSVGLAVVLFILVPTWAVSPLTRAGARPWLLNLAEGLVRVVILLGYVAGISRIGEIRRVLEYHGAEHKVIWAYESGEPLLVERARSWPRLHPRCGTAFLLVAVVVSIICFAFLGWPGLLWRVTSRLALLPLVAGVAYEAIKFSARPGVLGRALAAPGLWLQGFTTREPDDSQIEVAISALRAVLDEDGPAAGDAGMEEDGEPGRAASDGGDGGDTLAG
ncbi:MAG: DUF1385 domain-containing protein [Bacillota bacterium]